MHTQKGNSSNIIKDNGESTNKDNSLQNIQSKLKKVYTCKRCMKEHRTRGYLLLHVKNYCGKEYNCSTCTGTFTSRNGLNRHKLIHSGKNLTNCPICKKQVTVANLAKHFNTHHAQEDRKRNFQCHLCKKLFSNISQNTFTHTQWRNKEAMSNMWQKLLSFKDTHEYTSPNKQGNCMPYL